MTNELKFYEALENIFTGAQIEGNSGYVNLLKIKSKYYKLILNKFKQDVENEKIITTSFKEEFFDRLYSFFEKYFSESGSVYFVKTANWQRVYERVYTDNKDVVLFWKTHMLYYVKSDILFQSIDVTITDEETNEEYYFYFDVGGLKAKQNNEKKQIIFTFREIKEEKTNEELVNNKQGKKIYVFDVSYSEKGTITKTEEISKRIRISETILKKAFATFKKQSEVDFFINKNAKIFLTEQLDLYLHQILLADENKFEQKRLEQIKTIKIFAQKIIDFISQFEDELVRVWNKPKFALNSNYVVSIDKLNEVIINKISMHSNLSEQINEWIELGMIDGGFDFENREEKHRFLPIDTKYFKDLEIEILELFDNLDEALDGRLIHSENYQALNTLQEKYRGKVQCIYIDPPFNLGQNADFEYKVNYKDANWATLLENRLSIATNFMNDKSSIFVRCDYNGNFIVRCLLDRIFGQENFKNEIVVNRGKQRLGGMDKFSVANDSLFFYSKNIIEHFFEPFKRSRNKNEASGTNMLMKGERKPPERVFIDNNGNKVTLLPPVGQHWKFVQYKIDLLYEKKVVYLAKSQKISDKGIRQILSDGKIIPFEFSPSFKFDDDKTIDSNWTDISGYSADWNFVTGNAEVLLQRVVETASKEKHYVLDFFAGSATTQAVAQKLDRRWLGIEMGEHFYSVDIPRMKMVIYGVISEISKELEKKNYLKKGGFFKYYKFEQYEDTLRNMKYKSLSPEDLFDSKNPFEQYIFYADEKFAHVLEVNKNEIDLDFDRLYLTPRQIYSSSSPTSHAAH